MARQFQASGIDENWLDYDQFGCGFKYMGDSTKKVTFVNGKCMQTLIIFTHVD